MQNFGSIQQNIAEAAQQMNIQMPFGYQQIRPGQEFPVPITGQQNVPPRKPRNSKKLLAPQPPPQQQPPLMLLQQQQQLQQFQPPPAQQQQPPPLQQIDQITPMSSVQMGPPQIVPIGQSQIQQQRKMTPIRPVPPNIKGQPTAPQPKFDRESFFSLSESLCSFSYMDSVESDWIGDNVSPDITECIDNADDKNTDSDINSIQDYINVSNYYLRQNQ